MTPVTPERESSSSTTAVVQPRRQCFEHEFPSSVEMSHIVQSHMVPGLITDPTLCHVIRERVLDMFRLPRDLVYFCGALPVSLMRKDLDMLRTMEYLVAEKSDGLRHLMLLFRHNDQSFAVFIDRGNRCYGTAYKFSSHLREGLGTLLDGELVWERNTGMRYYVHDIVCVCGKTDVAFEKYTERMYHVRELLRWHIFPPDNDLLNTITFIPKQVFPLSELPHVVDKVIPNLRHRSDGLILTCNTLPHQGKKNTLLFKYKLPKDHTLDLQLGECVAHNTYELLTWDTHVTHLFETVSLSREKWAAVGVQSPLAQKGCILECAYDFEAAKWVPVNIRLDKIKPNDVSTIQLTLETMMETLSMEELRSIARHAKPVDTRIRGNPDDYGYKP